jgi:prepilin-type N-terminal cleavage/methylation domain-containing protein
MTHATRPPGDSTGAEGRGAPRSPAGFTLVEMLVALVITGVMAGAVISLLMGQNRFYGSTDDAVFAEQNLRATSDLLGSELRGIYAGSGSDSDLVTAADAELTFRLDTKRGVVCETTTDDVYVFLFSEPSAPNVQSSTRGHAVREAFSGSAWDYDGWDPMGTTMNRATGKDHTIAETCENGAGPTATDSNYDRFVVFENWAVTEPEIGAILRIYGEVTYSFGTSGFGSGTAIFRNGQELAAPFASDAAFSYVMDDGSVQGSVGSGSFGDVDRVRISATAVGEGQNRYDVTRDLQFDIPLKN